MIAIGNTKITKAYLGSTELKNVAIGDKLLLSSEPLPYDARVEYLESSGTQYIKTSIVGQNSYKYTVKFYSDAGQGMIFGARPAFMYKEIDISISANGEFVVRCGNQEYKNTSKVWGGEWYNVVYERGRVTNLDTGDYITTNYQTSNWNTSKAIYLFTLNNNGSTGSTGSKKISYFKIVSGSTVLIELIPVRVGTTGYMYDKVSKTLYGNAGSGNFILGNDL